MVVLAVLINTDEILKYSQIIEGNIADTKTLEQIITELPSRALSAGRHLIIVLGLGIATEEIT